MHCVLCLGLGPRVAVTYKGARPSPTPFPSLPSKRTCPGKVVHSAMGLQGKGMQGSCRPGAQPSGPGAQPSVLSPFTGVEDRDAQVAVLAIRGRHAFRRVRKIVLYGTRYVQA